MSKEKNFLDRKNITKNPDYYSVESDDEVFQMVKDILEETVYGQPEACAEVAGPITRSIGGFNDPFRPVYVGMFMGEPGVGKTEMGKAVAKIFDPVHYMERMKIVDCNIFQHSHDVSRITGAPPSYVGYGDEPLITEYFLGKPNVIVFDEIEKAHPALHRLLLRIMDKGRLDVNTEEVTEDDTLPGLDFSKSVILLTSNIGSEEIRDIKAGKGRLGFLEKKATQYDVRQVGIEAAREYWKHMPEFLNRIDSMVVFNSLTEDVVYKLVDKFLDEYFLSQKNEATYIMATDQLKQWLVERIDIKQAGRELKRQIERLILTPAAEIKIKLPKDVPLIADISEDEPKKVVFWVSKTMVAWGKNLRSDGL